MSWSICTGKEFGKNFNEILHSSEWGALRYFVLKRKSNLGPPCSIHCGTSIDPYLPTSFQQAIQSITCFCKFCCTSEPCFKSYY
jgi:hypothetical protein